MRKFYITLSLSAIALTWVASVFPPAAVLVPVFALVLGVSLVGGAVFFVAGLLGRLAAPRRD